MKKTFKIVSSIVAFVLVFSLAVSPAQAKAQDTPPNPNSATPAGIAKLVPYMSISKDGFFVLKTQGIPASLNKSVERVQSQFSEINAHLKELPVSERPHVIKNAQGRTQIQWLGFDSSASARRCVHVENWQVDAIAWIAIFSGVGYVVIGLFAYGTIFGIPLGAILQAEGAGIGVSGYFLLWLSDKYYPNGVNVCW